MVNLSQRPGTRAISIESTQTGGPLELLLACHERIRRFSDLAVRLTVVASAPPAELADAARSVHRYFTIAMPLHVQDEDLSIAPRLDPFVTTPVRDALARMTREHSDIERALEGLVPRWERLMEDPACLPGLAGSLAVDAENLHRLLGAHLELEERVIFPAFGGFDEAARAAIVGEMQGRRRPTAVAPPGDVSFSAYEFGEQGRARWPRHETSPRCRAPSPFSFAR